MGHREAKPAAVIEQSGATELFRAQDNVPFHREPDVLTSSAKGGVCFAVETSYGR